MDELLRTEGLVKAFGALLAVDNVDFVLPRREIRAIIGPNGAGKTTFFNLLTGHLAATEGTILFGGQKISGLSPAHISHKGIARSYQITNIFPNFSTFENIRLAVQSRNRFHSPFVHISSLRDVDEKTWNILTLLGLEGKAEVTAPNLSHGDQRLLEIGIALATDPVLLLLDEPTAGMGVADTAETAKLIKRISKEQDLTIILVEHDMDVVMEVADVITVLQAGRILAEGPPEEIKMNAKVQEAYLRGG